MLRAAAALSRTAEAAIAAAEAADAVGAELADPCDLAVVFASDEHAHDLASIGLAVESRLEPSVLLGGIAQGVVGPGEEVEAGSAVSVFAASAVGGHLQPFRAWSTRAGDEGVAVAGWPDTRPGDITLVLADPYSFPAAEVAARLGEQRPGQPVVGGLVTGGPDRSGLLLDGAVHADGAVGVVLREVDAVAVVSQGCRPVGSPLTVTAADRNRILELAGEPAVQRLRELLTTADPGDRELLRRGGLQVGLVIDEVRDAYEPGDFLVRGVLGIEEDTGALAVGTLVEVGQTVQFQVRDAGSAAEDLDRRLARLGPAAGTLLFTCNGRGRGLFGAPDHDVRAVEAVLGGAVAGAFCAGELGPVGAVSYLHGFTATMLVFAGRDAAGGDVPGGDVTGRKRGRDDRETHTRDDPPWPRDPHGPA